MRGTVAFATADIRGVPAATCLAASLPRVPWRADRFEFTYKKGTAMTRYLLTVAGLMGALSVGLGAATAHGLEARMDANAIGWVATASEYMLWHAAVLAACGLARPSRWAAAAGGFFVLGTMLFSGGLLAMAFFGLHASRAAVPIGGTALILGWLVLAAAGVCGRFKPGMP